MALRRIAARKKNANVTAADRMAIFTALPRNDQLRLYSPYEVVNAQAAASRPNTRPRAALSSKVTYRSFRQLRHESYWRPLCHFRNAAMRSFRNRKSAGLLAAPAVWPHSEGIGVNVTRGISACS